MTKLTHFNQAGEAHMVDIADKAASARRAVAAGRIVMLPETLALIREGGHKKGDVLGVARVAGIMATKRTAELVPMCHPLSLTHVSVEFDIDDGGIRWSGSFSSRTVPVAKSIMMACRAGVSPLAATATPPQDRTRQIRNQTRGPLVRYRRDVPRIVARRGGPVPSSRSVRRRPRAHPPRS